VAPFRVQEPELGDVGGGKKLRVTYDPEADAAFFYLPYGSRFQTLSQGEREKITKYSHSINPTATCELDSAGGLVSVSVPTADAIAPFEVFLRLFDVEAPLGLST